MVDHAGYNVINWLRYLDDDDWRFTALLCTWLG